MIDIINDDFRNHLGALSEAHLIATDPPYNIGFNYDKYQDDLSEAAYIELIAHFKDKPLAIIHYPEETMRYFVPALGVPNEVVAWCYNSNLPKQHRLVNFYGVKPDFNRVKQPYKDYKDKRIQEQIARGSQGARSYDWFSDIQLVKNNVKGFTGAHPCPVPVELMKRIILLTTNEGDLIIDPFMGSGSTAIACLETGRRFKGFEISEQYYNIAQARIQEHLTTQQK